MILGPGWIDRFEEGKTIPTLDLLLVLLRAIDADLKDLAAGPEPPEPPDDSTSAVARVIHAEEVAGGDLLIRFQYAAHDAQYVLEGATLSQFDEVIKTLRDGLARLDRASEDEQDTKTNAVASAFLRAVALWPGANPSDLWWFIVSRAYMDPFNHPARFARLDLGQSWKRTGGWALEEVVVRHYREAFAEQGVTITIVHGPERQRWIDQLDVKGRIEADKADVLLIGGEGQDAKCFGVVHVKTSFAERRTDDVPMSQALIESGYSSPLWTMDAKSSPAERPVNKGELGKSEREGRRSAKRKDIEDDGYFSACFSYNSNTVPTRDNDDDAVAKIHRCDFSSPNDEFAAFVTDEWERVKSEKL